MANVIETSEGQFVISYPEDDSCVPCHSCSSNMVKYTDESFTSCTDENESGQSYSQSFESYHPFDEEFESKTESEATTIESEMESLSPPNIKQETKEEFECCEDPKDLQAKQKFIEKHLNILKRNRFESSPHHLKEQYMVSRKEVAQFLSVESAPLQMYCHMKIEQIQRKFQQSESCKQVMETSMHQPSRCTACVKKLSKLAEHNFLRVKRIQLEDMLLQDKIEAHIYTKDALTQIGEIHRSLPKYSDAAAVVWKRLFDRKVQT